ncbi:hypothetical protein BR93DRAFT_126134 [Coniochaeta sp. PMI_546]|nr:hypothetical protein BR93DRAFT_126134 [Coniochaeta sp. PMI_546]
MRIKRTARSVAGGGGACFCPAYPCRLGLGLSSPRRVRQPSDGRTRIQGSAIPALQCDGHKILLLFTCLDSGSELASASPNFSRRSIRRPSFNGRTPGQRSRDSYRPEEIPAVCIKSKEQLACAIRPIKVIPMPFAAPTAALMRHRAPRCVGPHTYPKVSQSATYYDMQLGRGA